MAKPSDFAVHLVAGLSFFLVIVQLCQGKGKIEIKMKRYQSSCSDNLGFNDCDTYFYLCIDKPGPWDINSCYYKRFGPSRHYENTNTMNFGDNVGGITNPMVVSFDSVESDQKMFVVKTYDYEMFQSDEHLATMGKTFSCPAAMKESDARWTNSYTHSGSYHVWFAYRCYCDALYHTSKCNVYCKAHDDFHGHYTCNEQTGEKVCMRGWTGDNCATDIDECEAGPCYNKAQCKNLPGTYQCICPNGFTGQNCDLIESLCHSAPCQHNGTCSGDMQNYTCSCPFEWKGTDCEIQVDFCESNPCQHNASCYATVGNYTCACTAGWKGYHCTTEVDACESSPCQNGGTCTKKPKAEYECTCTKEYEGAQCSTKKNPCDPNRCQNSGTCTQLTYDTYNCTCVYGWDGVNCSSYLDFSSEKQHQEQEDTAVDWVPIVIAFVCALLLVLLLLALLYIRRRRRQKKELQARLSNQQLYTDVVQVAGHDKPAFSNALYDENNRSNSTDRSSRQQMPLPTPTSTVAPDDLFNPVKPKLLPEDEEQGAVGGANPYQDIDGSYLDPVTCAMGTEQKKVVGQPVLDTRTLAGAGDDGGQKGASNPYADFEDLKRRSIAARQASETVQMNPDSLERLEQAEENHYHDLDDVCLAIEDDANGTVHFNPNAAAASSHYDVIPTSNDATLIRILQGDGYMNMAEGASGRQDLENLDSTDEEDDGVNQEDIEQLRREVLQGSANTASNISHA